MSDAPPTPPPLPPIYKARWHPAKTGHATRPDYHDAPLTPRDVGQLIGDPKVLRWGRAH